jgi:nicotinamide mononucleotide transporter
MFSFLYDTFFTILDYRLSYLEFFATLFGLASVILATQKNGLTWPIGLVNIVLSFFLFHKFQLYADMLLQVFYLVLSISGWIYWSKAETEKKFVNWGYGSKGIFATTLYHKKVKAAAAAAAKKSKKKSFSLEILWG